MIKADFLLLNAGQLLTFRGPGTVRKRKLSSEIGLLEHGAMAAKNGIVVWTGKSSRAHREVHLDSRGTEVDVEGRVVTPGWVDSHTHPVFHGTRQDEFAMRAEGADYEEVAAAGGGILNSVQRTRNASPEALESTLLHHLWLMLLNGTTTVETKSGYGLDLDTEIRSLEVIDMVSETWPQTLIPTFLGAHEIPVEYRERPDEYIEFLIEKVLPVVHERKLARFVDIFCEKGVFTIEQSRKFLTAAKALGFDIKLHADEFHDTGGAGLAVELGASSADHLLSISEHNIRKLAESRTVATLLPGTAFFLGKPYPPARKLIDAGAAVALATDFNPGSCFCESIPFMINTAVCQMKMTVEEALVSATANAAAALLLSDRKGSLESGKDADFIVWNIDDYRSIAYHLAMPDIETVYTDAVPVASRNRLRRIEFVSGGKG